jgi:hypothetical protein
MNNPKNNPLSAYEKNVHSQTGEDGVLEQILKTLGIQNGWCVEFGAWDGKHLSNTYKLMQEGWSGVFIEGSPLRHVDLMKTYEGNPKAHCICAFVNFEGENNLDGILKKTPIPKDFGVLSIDIDGNDYHIWDSVKAFAPRVVVIEFNPTIPPHVEFVQPKDMNVNQGNSIASLVKLGKQKGYELVAMTTLNAFFVKKDDFAKFNIEDNNPVTMFRDRSRIMDVFQLYDGTLMFTGKQKIFWHGVSIKKSFQPIPKFFRVFPSVMGPVRLFLFKAWRKLLSK